MKKYLPQYTDQELKESIEYMGAVLITGPKWGWQDYNSKTAMQKPKRITTSCSWKILLKTCRHQSNRTPKK